LRVTADGQDFVCEAIYIAKGRYFAGPWSFAPGARLEQPMLHIVALPKAGRLSYVKFMVYVALGRIDRWSGVRRMTVQSLNIDCDQPQPVQIDGDIGCSTPIRIALAAGPLCG
jgi:diacylglycerol kinase family enzyme